MKKNTKNKYMKSLAVGLLASNLIAFGSQSAAFAETKKVSTKEQAQKEDTAKNVKQSTVSFAAKDGTEAISDLQKVMNEVLKEDNGVSDLFLKHTEEKAEQMGIKFDYLEVLKGLYTTALHVGAGLTGMEGVSFAIPFLDTLFPSSEKDVWEQIKPKVEALIDEKLDERFTKETLNSLVLKLQGLSKNMNTLKDSIKVLNGKGEKPVGNVFVQTDKEKQQAQVQMAVKDTLANINAMSEEFKNGQYAVASIPMYTQLGNIHIGILKDLAEHGSEWGYDQATVDQYKADLQKAIKTYSNTVYSTFTDGLNKIKTMEHSGNNWNETNSYVRTMTLTSLDFVSMWSTMDTTLYPQPTSLDRTRAIYSDMYRKDSTGRTDFDNDTAGQSYDTLLGKYNKKYPGDLKWLALNKFGTSNPRDNHINGIDQQYVGPGYDYTYSQWDTTGLKSKEGTRGERLGSASFSEDNPLTSKNFPDLLKRISDPDQIPVGHKISRIMPGFTDGTWQGQPFMANFVTAYVPEETHADIKVDGSHTVGISADKVTNSSKFNSVLEYVNGGNARKTSSWWSTLEFKVNSTKAQKFQVRYRVASNTGATIQLKHNDTSENTSIPNTETFKDNPQKGVTGLQGTYVLVDGPTVTLKPGDNTIQLESANGGEIVIDRMELMPLQETPKTGTPGWKKIGSIWYYYGKDGSLTKNKTIELKEKTENGDEFEDNLTFNENGELVRFANPFGETDISSLTQEQLDKLYAK
ncbi:insecticidal delta-endotoxin Cry8Ea1 family protein [Bacillus cereus]